MSPCELSAEKVEVRTLELALATTKILATEHTAGTDKFCHAIGDKNRISLAVDIAYRVWNHASQVVGLQSYRVCKNDSVRAI
jgi:hypothetical protein